MSATPPAAPRRTVVYFTTQFPVRSETAVIKEMHELERHGFRVWVISLKPAGFHDIHDPKADRFRSRTVEITPALLARSLVGHAGRWLRLDGAYFRTLGRTLAGSGRHLLKVLWIFLACPALAAACKRQGARYLHANFSSYQAYAAWVVHRLTGIPYGFSVHAQDIFLNRFMLREKAMEASLVASISEHNIRFMEETDGVRGEQVRLLRCGVDLGEFTFQPREAAGRPLRVLTVGRFHDMKGMVHLVRACGLLRGRLPLEALLVGAGEEEPRIRAAIREAGLEDTVRIRSDVSQPELLEAYASADAFVLPCQRSVTGTMDGIPATLMEAMAMGVPVVSTSISGIPELVEDGRTGLLVPPEDPPAIAAALERLAGEPGLVARLSREGRRRVEQEYDIRVNAGRFAEVVAAIVDGCPPGSPGGGA